MFNEQKRYFKKKLRNVQYMIWDMEFKRAKTQMIREEIRQDYDQMRSRLEILQTKIKDEGQAGKLKDINLDEFKRLEDQEVILKRDIDRRVEQMKGLDVEVQGAGKSVDYPDGVQGINDQLDAFRELQVMLREYIRQL